MSQRSPFLRPGRDLPLLVLLVVAAAIPFLGQPFHIDDNFYMDMARNARLKPLFPNDTPYVYTGIRVADIASHSHPPLQTYFLALMQTIVGEGKGREPYYHLAALAHPILAVVSFYFLSARFIRRPLWPALALACAPVFLVMQHNLMTDVPNLAFWLAAVALFLSAERSGRGRTYAASALMQFAAVFTSYQSLALTPLLAFRQLRRKAEWKGWVAIGAPPAALALWFAVNYAHYGRFLLADTFGWVASRNPAKLAALGTKLASALVCQGWLILFPFFLLYLRNRDLKGRLLPLAAAVSAWIAQLFYSEYSLTGRLILAVGLVAGVCVLLWLAEAAADAVQRKHAPLWFPEREGLFLALWYFAVFFYCVTVFTEGSARYLLPLAPPAILAVFRCLEMRETAEYRRRRPAILSTAMAASGALVFSLAWGLALSHADLEFARLYPRAAGEYARVSQGMPGYFIGEWGFRYYMRQAGAEQLPVDESSVRGGSWFARPRLAVPYDMPAALSGMIEPVETIALTPRTPLRLLDRETHAGFYSSGWGVLPFSWSVRAAEELMIGQVNFLVEALPDARIEGAAGSRAWPGYFQAAGDTRLALLLTPGASLSYAWTSPDETILEVACATAAAGPPGAAKTPIHRLAILQRDGSGRELSSWRAVVGSGGDALPGTWIPARLVLAPAPEPGGRLEFFCGCEEEDCGTPAAFARAILRRSLGGRR